MAGDKNTFLFILIVLILISIGGVWASEDQSTDDIVSADAGDIISVEQVPQADTSASNKNLSNLNDEPADVKSVEDLKENAKSSEMLAASKDNDILNDASGSGGNFYSLKTSMNGKSGIFTFNGDYNAVNTDWNLGRVSTEGIDISSFTTIEGNGHYIDLKNLKNGRIFTIGNGKSITIKNLVFKNSGSSSISYGGAVSIGSSSVTFDNCTFENCYASNGGAIYIKGTSTSKLTFINSNFVGNNATSTSGSNGGGAIYIEGGLNELKLENTNFTDNFANRFAGVINVKCNISSLVYINNCNFINNTAKTSSAGVIYFLGGMPKLIINNSNFRGNNALESRAGTIYFSPPYMDVFIEIYNSNFTDNYAGSYAGNIFFNIATSIKIEGCNFTNDESNTADGGALYFLSGFSGELTIKDSIFDKNSARYGSSIYASNNELIMTIDNCNFTNGKASYGGAIYASLNQITLKNSNFESNAATSNGGAIYFSAKVSKSNFTNLNFTNNSANLLGGAIYISASSQNILFDETNFKRNKLTSTTGNVYGGAIYINNGCDGVNFINCNFTENNAASGNGGALYFTSTGNNILISDSEFYENTALIGGAIDFYAGTQDAGFTNIDIIKSNFTNNNAIKSDDYGGSAIAFYKVKDVDFDNCRFENNIAAKYGALMFENYYDVYFNECNFTNNHASVGGAAYYRGSSYRNTTTYQNCIFEDNGADEDGGVIYSTGNILIIKDCNFTNNTANKGGVIYSSGNTLNITNSNFTNNTGLAYAGVVYMFGDYMNVFDSSFDGNEARPLIQTQRSNGGVLYILGNHVTIKDSNFTNNFAWSWGGSVIMGDEGDDGNLIVTDSLDIINCRFIKNLAYNAAAVDTYGTSNANIIHCIFEDNEAGQTAGALYMTGAYGRIDDCNFTNNKAIDGSAIMYIPPPVGDVPPTQSNIVNCNFKDNVASGTATVWFQSSGGKIMYSNFTNNTAKMAGAIYVKINDVEISNSNFTCNKAIGGDAGAIYLEGYANKISYCNFTNNTAAGNGGAVVLANSNQEITCSNFIGNNATNGGAVYVVIQFANLKIDDSTFTENTASNGGAIYCIDSSSTKPLTMKNDNFIDNTAIFNGGAVYYKIGSVSYRDYNLFENEGVYLDETSKRLTWTHEGDIIINSLFDGNEDYYMNASALQASTLVTITVTVPKGVDKTTGKVYIKIVDEDGNTIKDEVIDCAPLDDDHWIVDGEYVKIIYSIEDHELGNYNATVTFEDNVHYDKKESLFNYTIVETEVGDFTRLQRLIDEAIQDAIDNDKAVVEIIINGTFTYNPKLDKDGQINISSTTKPIIITGLTINGIRTIIDADNYCRIFDIFADNVTINNIGFRNGNASGNKSTSNDKLHGGAILWMGSNGVINNSIFRYNNAYDGGAVFVQSGSEQDKIINTEFQDNVAVHNGGAVDWNASSGNLTNSYLHGNNASYGGAVFVGADGVSSHIYNCNFTDNIATERGGAVDWYASTGDIIKSKFENNHAELGGAVFVGHRTDGGKIINSTFTLNTANTKGGAVDWNATGGKVIGSTFTKNSAPYGGAIFVGANSTEGTVFNSTFISNTAEFNGGAIDWNASEGNVNGSKFYNNSANVNGGAIFVGVHGDAGQIINSLFEGNNATNGRGGAVDWYASAGDIEYSNFTNNCANYGGAVFVGHQTDGGNITNSRFISNTATYNGGAVDWNASSGNLKHSYFEDNNADYGGALFIGTHSTGGKAYNNTYVANHARINGGAVNWNASSGVINNSKFYNNTAGVNGGAVYVGANTTSGHIVDSTFEGNNASNGRGGAVDWYATSGEIYNSLFADNHAQYGGAVFVGHATSSSNITHSNFTKNSATINGGAVDWNASNGNVIDSKFTQNNAQYGGAIFVGSSADEGKIINSEFIKNNAGDGGAVYLDNSNNVNVLDSNFTENTADNAGAIYIKKSDDILINNTEFSLNEVNNYAGAIYVDNSSGNIANSTFTDNNAVQAGAVLIISSNGFNIVKSSFDQNNANSYAGDISVDSSENIQLYNLTLTNSKAPNAASIYVNQANVTISEIDLSNWKLSDDASAILFDGGNSTLANSTLSGNNAILINQDSTVHLENNNNVNAVNGDYSVYNKGTLYLSKNTFSNIILNDGVIKTNTTTVILGNETEVLEIEEEAVLYGFITDDNNNIIVMNSLRFTVGEAISHGQYYDSEDKLQYSQYIINEKGVYIVSVTGIDGLEKNTLKTGTLKVKDPNTKLEFNITQQKNGEIVTIKAKIIPEGVTGNVTFIINGQQYNVAINQTRDVNDEFIATLTLNNLTPDTYKVTATYNGDDVHLSCHATEYFIINKRDSNISIEVENVVYNQDVIAVVTTTASNGTVTFIYNGRDKDVEVENGRATLNLTEAFGQITPGDYTISAYYNENTYYKASRNSTEFTVYKYDIVVEISETQFNQSAVITVTMPEDATGTPVVYLDGEIVNVVRNPDGTFTATTPKLTKVGEYEVNVTYDGDSKYFAKDVNGTKFNVTADSTYDFNIALTPDNPVFGDEVTINITGPAGFEVNVTVDGESQIITLDENGEYIITVNNFTAGGHKITANITGNENYTSKEITEEFNVEKATPKMEVIVPQTIEPNSEANVTVKIGDNATGTVIIYIDGTPNVVNVENGEAVLMIDTSLPGTHEITAKFFSDDENYPSASTAGATQYTIEKFNTTLSSNIQIEPDNHVAVNVHVDGDSEGNVTITLNNGSEYTVDVVDGVATFDLGIIDLQGYYNFTAVFNGNENYNKNSTTGNFTVSGLSNYTIGVTVSDTQYGDNTVITIELPEGADGTLTVKINDTDYSDNLVRLENGKYELVTSALDVGDYNVNVTYSGDERYVAQNSADNPFTVKANSSYEFKIVVTPEDVKYGENVTINITGPAGENVTVTIDGVNQTVTLDENGTAVIKLDNLTAGPHSIIANITGDENYTGKQISQSFAIDEQTPSMEIIVPETITPTTEANVTVIIGKNATGKVIISVDGVPTSVDVIDGKAVLALDTTKPGVHNITAEYFGDGNYTAAVNNTVKQYTIEKYNTTMETNVEIASDNHVIVTVNLNSTAGGNVTVYDKNNHEIITADVVDGVATLDLGIFDEQGEYNLNVIYNGDKNFNANSTVAEFNVSGLTNYTIDVEVSETQYGDNATITIKLPEGANGTLTVKIGEDTYHPIISPDGTAVITTPVLPVGDYNINVTYTGDTRYADQNNTENNLTVKTNSSYPFNVDVVTAPYGENTTVTVTGPVGLNVTVYVDDVPYNVTIGEDGTGTLKLDNITAGHHTVTANFTGDKNYTSKEIFESFDIVQQTPEIQIIVPQTPVTPNGTADIKVIVGKNATGRVTIKVNDIITTVDVVNGEATLPIENIQPGAYTVTAEFYGDDNYQGAVNDIGVTFTVDKYDAAVISKDAVVNDDNSVTLTIKLNETATGKVNITVAGKTYNATLTNGIAVIEIDPLANDTYNVYASYSGDENFNAINEIPVSFEVTVLRNFTVTIDITEGKYGENTTITVNVPAGSDGNVTIYIDGEAYPATVKPDGTATIELPLDVGNHIINATFTNSSYYADKNSTSYITEIQPQDEYPFNVTVTPAPFGSDTVITVNGPEGMKVNVTVDDEVYEVTIGPEGSVELILDNLTAGKHDIIIESEANKNYAANINSTSFTVTKQSPEMDITISDARLPNENVTVTVKVGDNATGFVSVTVDGKVYDTVEVVNGVAQFNVTGLQPGNRTIDVKFLGDDNYNASAIVSRQITMDKYETSIQYTKEVTSDNNVTIVVKLNETATGNVTITTPDGVEHIGFVENGVARVNLGILSQTEYILTANYNGDDNFNAASENIEFTVEKLENATVKVEVIPGEFGDNTTIKVTVPEDGDGNVTIYIDGVPTVVVPDENGVAIINVTPGTGPHEINVTYTNDTRYASKELNGTKFTVEPDSHYDFSVSVTPSDIKYGDEVTITVNAPAGVGEVNVTIDGVTVSVTIDETGKGEYKLSNLTAGDHTVIVKFDGNENYTAVNNSTSFTIAQATPEITVDVGETSDAGSDVVVNVTLNSNATGFVNINVDGEDHLVKLVDGKANYTVKSAQPGKHNITVTYTGDANYTGASEEKSFNVDTFESTMEILDITRGDDNNITVTVKVNGTGNVTVKIGDKTYNATVDPETGIAEVNIGNLPVEATDLNITYSGDDNFAPVTIVETRDIPAIVNYTVKVETTPIDYGDDETVTVTLPEGTAKEGLKIYVDDVLVDASEYIGDDVVTLTIPNPKAGEHTVRVVYEDDKHEAVENVTTFTVSKADIDSSKIEVMEPIDVGQALNITVDLPDDANGTITVDVNGTKYVFDVVNGSVNLSIPNLGNGTYALNITYSGDDNYDPISLTKEVTVEKVTPQIKAETSEITIGQNAVINVTVPDDATGTVTVKIGEIEKTVAVTGGENSIIIPDVPVGENQAVTITYNGNDKYSANTTTTTLTVKPQETKADDFKVEDLGNGTIIVTVPEGATGKVNLTIGNETYEVEIEEGKAVFEIANLTNQTPGKHNITLTYTGDGNNTPIEFNTTADVPKWDSKVTANIPTIRQGDVAKVNVTVTSTDTRGYIPSGNVRVEIDGKGYYGVLENGNVIIDVPGLSNGTHTVKVTYDGDDYYNADSTEESVTVQEEITVNVNGTGNSSEVVVQLPDPHTDNVTILIGGEEVPVIIDENGTARANLTNITPGKHNVTVIYVDEFNNTSTVNSTVNVPRWSSEVSASAPTIREGDVATITVTVSPDMTGNVIINVGETGYYATIKNGEAIIKAPGLKAGSYIANVTYLGDNKYDPSNNTFEITVEAPITIDINGTGNSSQVVIELPETATEDNVQVLIDGKPVDVAVENGTAAANLTGLEPGEHNITVVYTDEDGTQSVVNQTINVPRWDSTVGASAKTICEGDVATIIVELGSADMTGRVTVDIDGTGYYAEVSEGKAIIKAAGLKEGTYIANVTYEGNIKYDPSNNTFQVTVEAPITIDINGTGNSSQVVVELPENGSDNVSVIIDGEKVPVTVDNGTATANLTGLTPGEHNITVIYTDDDGTQSVVNQTITVPKWDSSVSASAPTIREGDVATITVKVGSADMTGRVFVDINGTGYYADLNNGEAVIIAPGLKAGTYDANVTYLGNDKYDPSNNTFNVVVESAIIIDMEGAGDSTQVVVTIPENGTDNVTVLVDGKEVPVKVENGTAIADLSGMEPGEHNVTVIYTDADGVQSVASKTINVYKSINAVNMTRGWNSPYDFEAEFLDKEGHVLADTIVTIKVNGKTYNIKTDENGIAKLIASKLAVGKYNVELVNPETGETATATTTIVKRLIENKDVTLDYDSGKYYIVRAIGDDGKPVGSGEVVGFKVNGVSYVGVTDAKGYAKLQINLNPKKYTITAQYANFKVSNKIVVKKTLKLVKNTVNAKKGKKIIIKAQLKWSNGKAIKGKKITIKFKGKKFTAKTNSKGIAKITIKNKKILKKLKKGKKYKFTAMYKKQTVKGKIKIKK